MRLSASLSSGSWGLCANPAQSAQQPCVKCDTTLGSPLRHSFYVCVHYIVCKCVSVNFLCACGVGGSGLHFYQGVCSSCPLACQRERHSSDTRVRSELRLLRAG